MRCKCCDILPREWHSPAFGLPPVAHTVQHRTPSDGLLSKKSEQPSRVLPALSRADISALLEIWCGYLIAQLEKRHVFSRFFEFSIGIGLHTYTWVTELLNQGAPNMTTAIAIMLGL